MPQLARAAAVQLHAPHQDPSQSMSLQPGKLVSKKEAGLCPLSLCSFLRYIALFVDELSPGVRYKQPPVPHRSPFIFQDCSFVLY